MDRADILGALFLRPNDGAWTGVVLLKLLEGESSPKSFHLHVSF